MNFRFAHYDPPPKKKSPKSSSLAAVASAKPRAKVVHRSSKAAGTTNRKSSSSKDKISIAHEEDKGDSLVVNIHLTILDNQQYSFVRVRYQHTPNIPLDVQTIIYRYLGQGRLDPFQLWPVEYVPLEVQESLDHALRNKWEHISPSSAAQVRHDWMQCALAFPVAFYALSFAASQHLNYLQRGRDPTSLGPLVRLSYKTEAVKLINRALSTLNGAPIPDSLLIAILSLGAHGHKPVPHPTTLESMHHQLKMRGPKSPLASAQMLDFYGHIDQETAHMSALRTLLAHNKGVGGIKLAGLAGALTLGDLLHSTITHQKPSLNVTKDVRRIACVRQFIGMEGGGFRVGTGKLPSFQNTAKLLNTLEAAQAVTRALDYWERTRPDEKPEEKPDGWVWRDPGYHGQDVMPVSKQELIHARNDVHHSLLTLPPANGLWGQQFALYEVLRVAGLVYSDLVMFPLPAETGVRGRYVRMMREAMEGESMEGAWKEDSALLLWCCVMGTVAAAELETGENLKDGGHWEKEQELGDRPWFVEKVRMCAEIAGVGLCDGMEGWDEVKAVCTRYLWWGPVCDIVGLGVWEEVVELQHTVWTLEAEGMTMLGKQEEKKSYLT